MLWTAHLIVCGVVFTSLPVVAVVAAPDPFRRCSNDTASTTDRRPFDDDNERLFLQIPTAASCRKNLKYITHQSHVAGTPGDDIMADFMVQQFRRYGIPQVDKWKLKVLLNYPVDRPTVRVYEVAQSESSSNHRDLDHGNVIFEASLSEDVEPCDPTSGQTMWRNHTFHGYSPSGHAIAPLVYANYGRPQDFDLLERAGIDVNGTIVLMRYGLCFRGLKVRNAQERGATGVLIYSDPMDDGYGIGPVYPVGPWRPPSGVQRGSVQFNSQCAGDPMRADPRYQSLLNTTVEKLCGAQSHKELIPSIPSLPLSYRDAAGLLQNIRQGPLASALSPDFAGGIRGVTYRVGPSQASVEMKVVNQDIVRNIPNVIGVIPGQLPPDQDMPVLLGNHRDAWVYGAADPNSGTAALLEVANGLGSLYKDHGWRPLRSVFLLSWSGEEYGLLGSTGWAELNEPLIRRALAYINVDTAVSGDYLRASASPSLVTLWTEVLNDFDSNQSLRDLGDRIRIANGPLGDIRDANTNWQWSVDSRPPEVGMLGSGSDYTVFLDHLGIPSLDFRLDKRTAYGQYHSVYDSFCWMDRYGGSKGAPGSSFELMAFASKIWGVLAMRMASSRVVHVDHVAQGAVLAKYVTALYQQDTGLDLKALNEAVLSYRFAAAILHVHCSSDLSMDEMRDCNEKLGLTERKFVVKEGLPRRPWFRHILQAPGMDLGYAAEAFPGVQQAIDKTDMDSAQRQVEVAAKAIRAAAGALGADWQSRPS